LTQLTLKLREVKQKGRHEFNLRLGVQSINQVVQGQFGIFINELRFFVEQLNKEGFDER
jgi:hypothetical protein